MEQRHLERILLPRPVIIRSVTLGFSDSNAVLRDISAAGAYCYTIMPLTKDDAVELFITLADSIGTSHLSFTGRVLRVEKGPTDNSVGVGIQFSAFKESMRMPLRHDAKVFIKVCMMRRCRRIPIRTSLPISS